MSAPSRLEIVPLGGLGEFGMNLMVYRVGEDCLVVDAGMMFPGQEHLGVDVVLPDMSFLDDCGTIHALILTHGHEDHIGAVPYLLARHDVPVYGAGYTLGLVRARLAEQGPAGRPALAPLPARGERLAIGPFEIECLPVAHSIPHAAMLVVRTPAGTVVHTADFKLDPSAPPDEATDVLRLAELGREGVLALLSDSTNAEVPGFTPSERAVAAGIEPFFVPAQRRIFVTTFASNVRRVREIVRLAHKHGRKVALVGASLRTHLDVAERAHLIDFPAGTLISAAEAMERPRSSVLVLASGTQGEPMSSTSRIALGKHREIALAPGDLFLHSARRIPGNEKSIGRLVDHLLRRGADVVTAADAPIHVSGHASRDELRMLIRLLRPRYLVPIHGEYRQLHAHAALGRELGVPETLIAESGDVIRLDAESIEIAGRVPVGQVFIDATQVQVDREILRDRRRVADDGIVVAVVAVDRESGAISGYPEIVTRGFVPELGSGAETIGSEAEAVIVESLAEASPEERADETLLRARLQADLKRFLRKRTHRQPLVVPVIVEL